MGGWQIEEESTARRGWLVIGFLLLPSLTFSFAFLPLTLSHAYSPNIGSSVWYFSLPFFVSSFQNIRMHRTIRFTTDIPSFHIIFFICHFQIMSSIIRLNGVYLFCLTHAHIRTRTMSIDIWRKKHETIERNQNATNSFLCVCVSV